MRRFRQWLQQVLAGRHGRRVLVALALVATGCGTFRKTAQTSLLMQVRVSEPAQVRLHIDGQRDAVFVTGGAKAGPIKLTGAPGTCLIAGADRVFRPCPNAEVGE